VVAYIFEYINTGRFTGIPVHSHTATLHAKNKNKKNSVLDRRNQVRAAMLLFGI